ncbi:hypothetical protein [Tsukamurella soli]
MEPTKGHWGFFDLVIKNFGTTPAYSVSVSFDQLLERVPFPDEKKIFENAALTYPVAIPFLAPGQEWRTVWDSINRRERADEARRERNLPALEYEYRGSIEYRSAGRKAPLESASILNWEQFRSAMTVETKTVHDIADSLDRRLKDINDQVAALHKSVSAFSDEKTGVWVYSGDADELRAYHADLAARARDSHEALMRVVGQLLPQESTRRTNSSVTEDSTPSGSVAEQEPPSDD